MLPLILLAAVLVIATIVVSLVTAYDIQRQRIRLAALDHRLIAIEGELELITSQKDSVDGTLDLHRGVREEKAQRIRDLLAELERLETEEDDDRQIGVSAGLRQRTMDDAMSD